VSFLKSVENRNFQNPLILEILENLDKLLRSGYNITFVWVPSHIGIEGNGAVMQLQKQLLAFECQNRRYRTLTLNLWCVHT
jgi:hypothetical protein